MNSIACPSNDVTHAVALLNRLNDMRMRDECSDLLLRSERGGTGVRVHSLVMAALSPYIDSALSQQNDLMHTAGGDASAARPSIEQRVDVGVRAGDAPTGEGGKDEGKMAGLNHPSGTVKVREVPGPSNDVTRAVALLNRLNDMRMRDECSDLLLRSERGGTGVRVHSLVMAALSPYIDSALTQQIDLMHTGDGDASAARLSIEQRVDVGVRVGDVPTGEGDKDEGKMAGLNHPSGTVKVREVTLPGADDDMVNAVTEFVYRGIASLDPHQYHDSVLLVGGLQSLGMDDAAERVKKW